MSTSIDPLLQITPTPAPAIDRGAESGASFADELQRAQKPEEPPAAGPARETKPDRADEGEDAKADRADETAASETSGQSTGEDEATAAVESDSDQSEQPAETVEEAEDPSEDQPEDTVELSEQAAAALGLVAEETAISQQAADGEAATAAAEGAAGTVAGQTSVEDVAAATPTDAAGNKAAGGQGGSTEATTALPTEAATPQTANSGEQGDSDDPQQPQTSPGATGNAELAEGSDESASGYQAQQSAQAGKQEQSSALGQESRSPALPSSESTADGEAADRAPQAAPSALQSLDTQPLATREAAAAVVETTAPEAAPTDNAPKQNDAAGPPTIQRLFGERGATGAQQTTEEPTTATVDRGRFVSRVANAFRVAQQRDGEIQLRLSPPQLGSLKITLTVQDGALAANLEADSPAARGVLLDNLPALRERLAEQEIRVEKFDVNVRDEGGGQPGDAPEGDHRNSQESRQNGQSASVETTGEASELQESSVTSDGALDVRI